MHHSKRLMLLSAATGLALTAYGAGHDLRGLDGQGARTLPFVMRAALDDASHTVSPYIATAITGDTVRMAPRYHRAAMQEEQTVCLSSNISFTMTHRDA